MRYRRELAGLGASAMLMAAGLLLLPEPGFNAVPHIFAFFWLAITAGAMLGYGVSTWRAVKLQRIYRRRRRKTVSPAMAKAQREAISAALVRERERRLD